MGHQNVRVNGASVLLDVDLTLDTNIYASGDVLADTQIVSGAFRVGDGTGILQNMTVIDSDDQGAAFDVYFLSSNVSMGTENAGPSISDANAKSIVSRVQVGTGDYYDLGGVKIAEVTGLARVLMATSGTKDLYVAVVNGTGTPTYTATGVRLRLGILQD